MPKWVEMRLKVGPKQIEQSCLVAVLIQNRDSWAMHPQLVFITDGMGIWSTVPEYEPELENIMECGEELYETLLRNGKAKIEGSTLQLLEVF